MARLVLALAVVCAWEVACMAADTKPTIAVEQEKRGERTFTMVRIKATTIPGCECDIWCYEDAFGVGEAQPQPDGSMVLKHQRDGITATTRLVPLDGAVDFRVTVEAATREQVLSVTTVNPCWQLRRSDTFGNRGEFPHDFVPRCFIYTVAGFTPFSQTVRFPDTRQAADHRYNTPPWVQVYVPIWRVHAGQPQQFWGHSTSRPVASLIGVVSREGKYLTAFGWRRSYALGQGWHDCLHPHPDLRVDYDEKTNRIVSRGKLYFMENNPAALLEAYQRDFPPEPATLTVEPQADGLLKVLPRSAPGLALHLSLPELRPDSAWVPNRCFAISRFGKQANAPWQAWAFAHADAVHLYLSVRNESQQPLDLPASAMLRLSADWRKAESDGLCLARSADGEWLAALIWEHGATTSGEDGLRVTSRLVSIPAGETHTLRGALLLAKSPPDALRKRLDALTAEWQRARPFRVPLKPDGGGTAMK